MTQNASKFKIALIQLSVTDDKQKNLQRASQLIHEASQKGASVIALPECFNSPYGTKFFPQYAEKIPGETTDYLSKVAKETKVYLVGGSIPEQDGENYYNTSTVYNPEGEIIAKHRKVHLFDIDVPGKIRFQESEILKPGNQITTFDTKYGRFGLAICYDIRFPELSMLMAKKGCQMLLFPGAFNLTTGPAHWQLLQTARAVDNQVFVAGISPARDEKGSYVAWGHSTVVNPWGQILATTEEKEDIVYADIDFSEIAQFRQSLPITSQKRYDLYSLTDKTEKNVE